MIKVFRTDSVTGTLLYCGLISFVASSKHSDWRGWVLIQAQDYRKSVDPVSFLPCLSPADLNDFLQAPVPSPDCYIAAAKISGCFRVEAASMDMALSSYPSSKTVSVADFSDLEADSQNWNRPWAVRFTCVVPLPFPVPRKHLALVRPALRSHNPRDRKSYKNVSAHDGALYFSLLRLWITESMGEGEPGIHEEGLRSMLFKFLSIDSVALDFLRMYRLGKPEFHLRRSRLVALLWLLDLLSEECAIHLVQPPDPLALPIINMNGPEVFYDKKN